MINPTMAFQTLCLPSVSFLVLSAVGTWLSYVVCKTIWHAVYNLFLSPLRKFPGPKFAALTKWWEVYHAIKCDRFIVIQKLHEKYGNVIRIGPNEVSIASPRVFHHIFVTKCSSFLKSDFYTTIQPGLGPKYAGLFNETNHAKSQAERRDLQPGMAPARIKVYEKRYDAQLDQLIQVMKKKQEVDLFTLLKFLMLDVIGDLALGQTFKQLETGEEHQYAIDFNNAFMLIGLQNTFAPIIPLIPYLPFKKLKDAHAGLSRVFIYAQEKVVVFLSKPMEEKRQSVMSGFLDAKTGAPKPPYTPWYIALAGHGFLVAGSEASSITLSYFIWLLIKHPEVEQRLRHELSTLQPHYTSTDLALRPYLDAVLRETLRVYPPAPAPMPRVVPAEGFSMEGMDYPPKTVISAQPYTIHRAKGVFQDPETFNPDRWLNVTPEAKEQMNRAFVPFSAGQRGCIGRGLAWMHMLKAIARLLKEFDRFELREDMTDDDMTLIERGALAKPKSTKLWVRCHVKAEPGFKSKTEENV